MPDKADEVIVSRDLLVEEMQAILGFLLEQARAGKRMRLSDARSRLSGRLSLDFADYFKFLKRYNYVVINRTDHGLAVTEEGRGLVEDASAEPFSQELEQHFGDQMEAPDDLIEMRDDSFAATSGEPAVAEPAFAPEPAPDTTPARPARRPAARAAEERRATGKGTKFDSRYTRYEMIGSGGIGTVYRGRLNALALDVAIKEIKELFSYFNFLQRSEVIRHLRDAVGQMAMLQHPLVVQVFDQNTDVAHPYFVTEYLPGGNLGQQMAGGRLDLDRALVLFTQICYALQAAHRNDVLHGNLKPDNILFDVQGNVRVTDFGITRLLETDSDRSVPRVVTGSIGYLAPEQMADAANSSSASDIYSLGILFYEMLTGNLPGRRSPLPSAAAEGVPAALDELFDRMTRDEPADRYPDMDAVLDAFYDAIDDKHFPAKGRMILFAGLEPPAGAAPSASAGPDRSEAEEVEKQDASRGKKKK